MCLLETGFHAHRVADMCPCRLLTSRPFRLLVCSGTSACVVLRSLPPVPLATSVPRALSVRRSTRVCLAPTRVHRSWWRRRSVSAAPQDRTARPPAQHPPSARPAPSAMRWCVVPSCEVVGHIGRLLSWSCLRCLLVVAPTPLLCAKVVLCNTAARDELGVCLRTRHCSASARRASLDRCASMLVSQVRWEVYRDL
jgi:hypothetical protein